MYRSDKDPELKRRIDYIVQELATCQGASPSAGFNAGYLSAFPESHFDRLETQQNVWAPYYALHKIFQGLIDAYRIAGSKQAFDVAVKMADWLKGRVDILNHEQMQAILEVEFGGMTEVLANLYSVSGNPEHLRLSRAFDHEAVLDPLAERRDELSGLHANTQIPKAIGAAKQYELTGIDYYGQIARFFWERVALHHSFVTGGNSDREYFFDINEFHKHLGAETSETCNTYNMLRLTRKLFSLNPDPNYIEFYERGLYNHILASQDPAQGLLGYFLPMKPGHYKVYSSLFNSFWCCMGTGLESQGKYGDTIFAHTEDTLYVNLFISAEVDWKEKGVKLKQQSNILTGTTTRYELSCEKPTKFKIRLRHPSWAKGELTISINGNASRQKTEPGTWFELSREWQSGDVVEIDFPMELDYEFLPTPEVNSNANQSKVPTFVAIKYGPLVLAGLLGNDGMPRPNMKENNFQQNRSPDPAAPVFVTNESLLVYIQMLSRNPLVFKTDGLGKPQDVTFIPLYKVHHERFSIYWNIMPNNEWLEYSHSADKTMAEIDELAKNSIDRAVVGSCESEFAHSYKGTENYSGVVSDIRKRIIAGERASVHDGQLSEIAGTESTKTV